MKLASKPEGRKLVDWGLAPRSLSYGLAAAMILVIVAFLAPIVMRTGRVSAQQVPIHLNPAVEKLAHGFVAHHRHANR